MEFFKRRNSFIHRYRERSDSEVECLTGDRGVAGLSLTGITALCPWARHINPSLVLLIGRKESNQTNKTKFINTWIEYFWQWSKYIKYYFRCFLCPQRNFGRHIVIALSVRPSVPLSCPVHISYILWGRNSKFGVWIHLGMAECRVPFSGHCDLDLDLWPSFKNNRVRSISLINLKFEVWMHLWMTKCRVP